MRHFRDRNWSTGAALNWYGWLQSQQHEACGASVLRRPPHGVNATPSPSATWAAPFAVPALYCRPANRRPPAELVAAAALAVLAVVLYAIAASGPPATPVAATVVPARSAWQDVPAAAVPVR
jgi:hypothetical protein